MSFLHKFVSFDKTEEIETPRVVTEPAALRPVSRLHNTGIASSLTIESAATVNDKIVKTLENAVATNSPPEYKQFRAFYDSLASLPEESRYPAVLAVARAANLTPEVVVSSMDARINLLNTEKSNFTEWFNAEHTKEVDGRKKAIAELEERIKSVTEELTSLTNDHKQITVDMSTHQSRLTETHQEFLSAYDAVMKVLIAERDKIVKNITTSK